MSRPLKPMLYTPFFHMGAILILFGIVGIFVFDNYGFSRVISWVYIAVGTALMLIKIVWVLKHRDEIEKLLAKESENTDE